MKYKDYIEGSDDIHSIFHNLIHIKTEFKFMELNQVVVMKLLN